jgi:hypothetical protein
MQSNATLEKRRTQEKNNSRRLIFVGTFLLRIPSIRLRIHETAHLPEDVSTTVITG